MNLPVIQEFNVNQRINNQNSGPERQLVVVVGMHRSGTSVITRSLQSMGVKLGDRLMPGAAGINDKGFYEDLDIVVLNEEILSACGKSWYSVEPIQPIDVDYLCDRGYLLRAIELIRSKLAANEIFGFKDPRTAKLMPFWIRVFTTGEFDVRFVLALRNPLSVAKSLEKRDGIHAEHAYLLWLDHVLTSLFCLQKQPVIAVDYDQLLLAPKEELQRVSAWLGKSLDQDDLAKYCQDFLDERLCHSRFLPNYVYADTAALALAKDIYGFLIDVQAGKARIEDASESGRLVQWREEFNRLRPVLRLADKQYRQIISLNQALAEREGQIANLNQAIAEREGQIANLNQALAEREGQVVNLNQAIAEREGQIANLNQALAEREGQVVNLNQAIAEREGQIANLNQALAERERQIANLNQALAEREGQIANPNQAMAEREGQIANLNQALAEREGQIANLNQALAEREGQIANLNQALAEREGQIANLNQALAEREGQIANLNQALAEREGQI